VAEQIMTLSKIIVFYTGDSFNHFKPVTKKNSMELFGKKQNEAHKYLKENKWIFSTRMILKK